MLISSKSARIVRFDRFGGPDVLRIEFVDVPGPVRDEVRIRVKAFGLNRADAMFRRGNYIDKPTFPSRLGYEAAGIVDAVGEGVSHIAVGDAVCIIPPTNLSRFGTYGELATVPSRFVVKKPHALTFEAAASTWMQYLTAYGGLIEAGGLRAGNSVLITAASSSVGLAAIQIAMVVGATPIATTLRPDKKQALLKLGVRHVIATQDENLGASLAAIAPQGLQLAFDAVGGPQVGVIAEAMAKNGVIVSHGMLDPDPTPFPLRLAIRNSLVMRGYVFSEIVNDADKLNRAKQFIVDGLTAGTLKPVIDRVFPFEKLVEAHQYLESNQQIGKIVVSIE